MTATTETDLRYALQACRSLEQTFQQRGDRESVIHFQKRQREIQNQLSQICRGAGLRQGMASRCRSTAPQVAGSALLSVCSPERVNVPIGRGFSGGAA